MSILSVLSYQRMHVSINRINNVKFSGLDQFQGTIERFWEIMRRIRGPKGAVFFRSGFSPNSLTIP